MNYYKGYIIDNADFWNTLQCNFSSNLTNADSVMNCSDNQLNESGTYQVLMFNQIWSMIAIFSLKFNIFKKEYL